jgi:hypothetical protein
MSPAMNRGSSNSAYVNKYWPSNQGIHAYKSYKKGIISCRKRSFVSRRHFQASMKRRVMVLDCQRSSLTLCEKSSKMPISTSSNMSTRWESEENWIWRELMLNSK